MTQHFSRKQIEDNRKKNTVNNGLTEALNLPTFPNGEIACGSMLSRIFNYSVSNLITMRWVSLTNAYNKNSFLQTAVNQKVEDAFKNDGLIIDSKTLDTDELELLRNTMEEEGDIEAIIDCIRWGRLYGGGVIIANTEQDASEPLDRKNLKGKRLKFIATNRWQCYADGVAPELAKTFTFTDNFIEDKISTSANNQTVDASRVGIFHGSNAPYLTKQLLQGWNASIFEGVLEPIENMLGGFNVTLELLSEAKIDIFKISDLATVLMSPDGERQIERRLQIATANKNFKSSIAMDKEDDYEQKQISFGGIPQLLEQLMYIFCGYLRYPVAKLFGKGASGFSSGDDDLENYNATVESEVRIPARRLIHWVVNLRCLQLFGRELPDFKPKWKPLREMSEKDMAEVNSRKLADYINLLEHQVMTPRQVAQKLTEDSYILFSDEELDKLSDEVTQPDMSNDIQEDLNFSG
jgi:phage-related protein (TIGR01555 family)